MNVSIDHDFIVDGIISLSPGDSHRLSVSYAPTEAGEVIDLADGLMISSNAVNNPSMAVGLKGQSTFDADISYDGIVSFGDLGPLNAHWSTDDKTADINGDGVVSFGDLGRLNTEWGNQINT